MSASGCLARAPPGRPGELRRDRPRTSHRTLLAAFFTSDLGLSKPEKLNAVSNAAQRHLVIVLDPTSPEGIAVPLGLSDRDEPGAAGLVMPSFVPPERLTHLWLFPTIHSWDGLRWARGEGWAIVPPLGPAED